MSKKVALTQINYARNFQGKLLTKLVYDDGSERIVKTSRLDLSHLKRMTSEDAKNISENAATDSYTDL